MKFLIWALSIFITSIVAVLIKSAGITLGAIPTMVLYAPLFFITPKLCKKWDEYKIQRDTQKEKLSSAIVSNKTEINANPQHTVNCDFNATATQQNHTIPPKKKIYCRQCNAELPEGSAFCNKCGARVEAKPVHKEPPVYIDSLFSLEKEHVGKYVQLIGKYSWHYINKEPLKCNIVQHSMRGSMYVTVELLEPLPEYVLNTPVMERQPIILRGILAETSTPYHEYVLKDAEYQGYWRNETGKIRCMKEFCEHKCTKDCPIYLNNLGKEKYDEYNRDEAIDLFKRAVLLTPDFSEARCNLGYAYLDFQNYTDAYESFCEAEKYAPCNERVMYGEIVALSKVGRQKEAQDLLTKYKRLFPNKRTETLTKIISNNLASAQEKPRITDEEYARLLAEKGFDEFWKTVVEEKERSFATQACKYTGEFYRKRCNLLEGFVSADVGRRSERLYRLRQTLVEDNVQYADSMLLFDVIDEYVSRYIRF